MTARKMRNFRIDPELEAGLRAVRERDGIAESEQIRRGIRLWLQSKRVIKADRQRATTRKRP
jgi:hypothetical protein